MGIFDRLRGRRAEEKEGEVPSSSASPSLDLTEAATTELPSAPVADAAVTKAFAELSAQSKSRLYNPYEGLGAALDRRDGHRPTFVLPDRPEFLFDEEASVHTRSWSENLTYYTGVGYLSGALLGGARGGYGALSTPLAVTAGADSSRLRVNALLNGSGRAGRTSGNALGALGLFFASFESFAHYLNSDGWVPEEVPTLAAGAFSGAIYRSPRGPRQAAAAGAIGLAAATALLGARTFISRGL